MVLRIALAQMLGLNTPPHAAISTVLPLVDGGPRKLVHGVFGTLARRGVTAGVAIGGKTHTAAHAALYPQHHGNKGQ